ncbi:exo-beta-N-acetylmuramidase NamZ domain-containing protein [Paenibacillus sp. FSL K6-0108]|uniref:exo-beta-N-acetylmuramidase NamZ family protein n=1 Tax=Paenibacillus sp. FSL K6-0108 TaxID=2921417 RepID=UPI00324E99E9
MGRVYGAEQIPAVKTGADLLSRGLSHPWLTDARIGLITNPTGITANFVSTVQVCAGLANTQLTALYACEHGLDGELQAGVRFGDRLHPTLGIPVFSLYGKHKKPTPAMLAGVDAVLYDIQDVGVRYYTYASTLFHMMEACAEAGKRLLVLDRPNPLGGDDVEGGVLSEGYESLVGAWRVPVRTGLTVGELALLVNSEMEMPCELDVIAMEGWQRSMEFSDCQLPWMLPSPNMPTLDSVRVYAGTCLFEGTNVSEGRGTTRPFEWIGAPWIEGERLAERFREHKLEGVHVHPVYMSPTFSKHAGELCGGVRIFVTDSRAFRAVDTGLVLLHELVSLYPEQFRWLEPPQSGSRYFIDLLTGSRKVRDVIHDREELVRLIEDWNAEAEEWKGRRRPFLLYP